MGIEFDGEEVYSPWVDGGVDMTAEVTYGDGAWNVDGGGQPSGMEDPAICREEEDTATDAAGLVAEAVPYAGDEIEHSALAAADDAREAADSKLEEADALEKKGWQLIADARAAQSAAVADRDRGYQALHDGRVQFWNAVPKEQGGYIAGDENVARATLLSPPGGMVELAEIREQRVHTVLELSHTIRAGEPAVIVCKYPEDNNGASYIAGISEHDGFSVRSNGSDPGVRGFVVGINRDTTLPINRVVEWEPDSTEFVPCVQVCAGEQAKTFLAERRDQAVDRITNATQEINAIRASADLAGVGVDHTTIRYRTAYDARIEARTELLDAVTVSRAIDPDAQWRGGRAAADALLTHMFDVGDAGNWGGAYVTQIAEAYAYTYPAYEKQSARDYLVTRSAQQQEATRGGHSLASVIDVLVGVFGDDLNMAYSAVYGTAESSGGGSGN